MIGGVAYRSYIHGESSHRGEKGKSCLSVCDAKSIWSMRSECVKCAKVRDRRANENARLESECGTEGRE